MATQDQQQAERISYLFGYPIAHSLSPLLHNTVYTGLGLPWTYQLLESTDFTQFVSLLKQPRCFGSAVTMPHKVAIIPYLDDVTEEGREVGACNTIFIREGADGQRKYIGTNTDVVGIRESFTQNVSDPARSYHNRPGLVVGGGGAARSAVYALNKWLRCTSIYIVNRDKAEVDAVISSCQAQGFGAKLIHVSSVEQAQRLEGPGAIVACIPDFAPSTDAEWNARRITETFLNKSHKGAMLEMAYHPKVWTRLAQIAHDAEWQVILGTEAMIWQGLEQDRLWTGKSVDELPIERVKEAVAAKLDRAGIPWLNEGPLEEPKSLHNTMNATTTTAIAA